MEINFEIEERNRGQVRERKRTEMKEDEVRTHAKVGIKVVTRQ